MSIAFFAGAIELSFVLCFVFFLSSNDVLFFYLSWLCFAFPAVIIVSFFSFVFLSFSVSIILLLQFRFLFVSLLLYCVFFVSGGRRRVGGRWSFLLGVWVVLSG
jgi:hypothetical protein